MQQRSVAPSTPQALAINDRLCTKRQRQAEKVNPYLMHSRSHIITNNCSHFLMQYDAAAFANETSVKAIDPFGTMN